jgi:flagellar hook-associated protein 1
MPNLNGAMYIAVGALLADQAALQTTSNNISNVNTPGYSRQRPVFVEAEPSFEGSITLGMGVVLNRVESLRDPVLELRMNAETEQQSSLDAQVSALKQLQVMFSGTGSDLGDQISKFFSSIDQLSADAGSIPLRQAVLTAASNLANSFQNSAATLQQQRVNLDLKVSETVQQVNILSQQIADLNQQVIAAENLKQDASTLIDQRTIQIRNLAKLVDVAVISTENGVTVTTSAGTALVAGNKSFSLQTQVNPSGLEDVYAAGLGITNTISAGELAGVLQVRDGTIPKFVSDLDTLASGLANGLNAANHAGFDLNGAKGGDLFIPPPVGGVGAAGALALQISDPSLLAAAGSDGTGNASSGPGSNANLALFSAVYRQPIGNGKNPTDFYSDMVFRIGNEVANGTAESDASGVILQQLESQRSSTSGVSLDEEAASLITYQHAYAAAARVISTISELMDTAVNLGRQ